MPTAGFAVRVTDGMEDEVRDLAAMLRGSLRDQNTNILEVLGIESEQIWLGKVNDAWYLFVVLEGEDPAGSIKAFLELEEPPVGIWLKDTAITLADFNESLKQPMELLLESGND